MAEAAGRWSREDLSGSLRSELCYSEDHPALLLELTCHHTLEQGLADEETSIISLRYTALKGFDMCFSNAAEFLNPDFTCSMLSDVSFLRD